MSSTHLNYGAIALTVLFVVAAPVLLSAVACVWKPSQSRPSAAKKPMYARARSRATQIVYDHARSLSSLAVTVASIVGRGGVYAFLGRFRLLTDPVELGIGLVTEAGFVAATIVAFNAIRYERKKPLGMFALTLACWLFWILYVVALRRPFHPAE